MNYSFTALKKSGQWAIGSPCLKLNGWVVSRGRIHLAHDRIHRATIIRTSLAVENIHIAGDNFGAIVLLPVVPFQLRVSSRPSTYTTEPLVKYWLQISASRTHATTLNQSVCSTRSPSGFINVRETATLNEVTGLPLGV